MLHRRFSEGKILSRVGRVFNYSSQFISQTKCEKFAWDFCGKRRTLTQRINEPGNRRKENFAFRRIVASLEYNAHR